MVVVAVIVYNRLNNVQEWIRCWQQCNTTDAQLVIIHNYANIRDTIEYEKLCKKNNITYVPRFNVGFDIGAFQDVCRGRLEGFPTEYDYLLWCTDDILPMNKEFIQRFLFPFKEDVSCVCYELSQEITQHIRTTGFMLRKRDLINIVFAVPNIIDKEQCYEFEHKRKSKVITLFEQVVKWGRVAQVDNIEHSPLWDSGHDGIYGKLRYKRRFNEHKDIFAELPIVIDLNPPPTENKITFICPIFDTFPEIVSSLINQTYKNWELLLIHDGPNSTGLRAVIDVINDKRIKFIETEQRKQLWGHPLRNWALENLGTLAPNTSFVCVGNADNHIMPHFCEFMLRGFENPYILAVYCSAFIHSYDSWQKTTIIENNQRFCNHIDWEVYKYGIIDTRLQLGYIDSNCVVMRKNIAVESGWNDMSHSSDFSFFKRVIDRYGADRWKCIRGTLLVHN
jgi:hypothetical protein